MKLLRSFGTICLERAMCIDLTRKTVYRFHCVCMNVYLFLLLCNKQIEKKRTHKHATQRHLSEEKKKNKKNYSELDPIQYSNTDKINTTFSYCYEVKFPFLLMFTAEKNEFHFLPRFFLEKLK